MRSSALLVLIAVGCSSERFQLANRNDTPYNQSLARNDIRVPVNPPGDDRATGLAQAPAPQVPLIPSPAPVPSAPAPAGIAAYPLNPTVGGQSPVAVAPIMGVPAEAYALSGKVVTSQGLPAARVPIQVMDLNSGFRVVAESATDAQGIFRIQNVPTGGSYRVVAASQDSSGRLVGSATIRTPDPNVVIQLQPENLVSGGPSISLPGTTSPIAQAGATNSQAIPYGSVSVSTIQAIPAAGSAINSADTAQGLARVLPPARPSPQATPPTRDITWDEPAISAPKNPVADINFADSKEINLDLPKSGELELPTGKDLALDDFSADPKEVLDSARSAGPSRPVSAAPTLAFAGTGLEYERVMDLEGNRRPLGALAGEVILLDFYGSWCGPCRRSIPKINDLYSKYQGRGLHVVGVSCEHGQEQPALRSANDAVDQLGIRYPVVVTLIDEPSLFREHFSVSSYPTVVLVNRAGRVLYRGEGGTDATLRELENAITRSLTSGNVAAR